MEKTFPSGTIFYGGCKDRPGHYLWAPTCSYSLSREIENVMPKPLHRGWDGQFAPTKTCAEGVATLHYIHGWTILAFWDQSVDRRPGSNSIFFAEGVADFDTFLARCKIVWPNVFARFDFEVTPLNG